MHIDMRTAFADQSDFQSDASGRDGVLDAKLTLHNVHFWRMMGAAQRDCHRGGIRVGANAQQSRRPVFSQKCATSQHRVIQFLSRWLIDDADAGFPIDGEPDHHSKLIEVIDEFHRAIERIDDPDTRVGQS